uniref:Snaclec coagulation factor IX/factor X-binding protein subunit A-like n=1 Tax=Scleropages formosus TaxID=113540 RepID=A0A8C9V1C4_SCLFO
MCLSVVWPGLHAVPLRDNVIGPVQSKNNVPVESRRQGTQPSRRHLINLNTGLLIDYVSEMDRHIGNLYVPPSPNEFRQGTQNSQATLIDHRTGEVLKPVGEMQRSSTLTELRAAVAELKCDGEVINSKCYHFFSNPQTFDEAESTCGQLSPNGHLASVTSPDLHSRLVFMVTEANNGPVLTWIGGVLQGDQLRWSDGSSWTYSDWMPGEPRTDAEKEKCLEMFENADCESKRAFICSYSITA